jgi:hypothetical protein
MQTTMTASEFEKNVESLLQMVRNGSQLDLKIVPDGEGSIAKTARVGWSDAVQAHLNNPNPNWHLEPDFLPPKEMDDYRDPFADEN